MFDKSLAEYALNLFNREGVTIKTEHHIESVLPGVAGYSDEESGGCKTLKTREEGEVGVGMVVWSTGLMMNPFVQKALSSVHSYPSSASPSCPVLNPGSLDWELSRDIKTGGLVVDERFRVKLVSSPNNAQEFSSTGAKHIKKIDATIDDVFAIGDVSVFSPGRLPATAQVANQQAKWLAKRLNAGDLEVQAFTFRNLGIMTYIGNMNAIMQTGSDRELKGRTAWLLWRGVYMTQAISWRNKIMIPIYWAVNWVFGRDISRF
jgi:NADH dehydrogenase